MDMSASADTYTIKVDCSVRCTPAFTNQYSQFGLSTCLLILVSPSNVYVLLHASMPQYISAVRDLKMEMSASADKYTIKVDCSAPLVLPQSPQVFAIQPVGLLAHTC